jgi:hypothetical protein
VTIAVYVRTSGYQSATLLPNDKNEDRSGSLRRSGLAKSNQIRQELVSTNIAIERRQAVALTYCSLPSLHRRYWVWSDVAICSQFIALFPGLLARYGIIIFVE